MTTQKAKLIILLIGILFPSCIVAQQKFEKEYRIKEPEVPIPALKFIKDIEVPNNIKWYKEESQNGKSIEAKFKYSNTKYSVEFDVDGNIEDIEFDIKQTVIPSDVIMQMNNELMDVFEKYEFKEIQQQYTGDRKTLLNSFQKKGVSEGLIIKYEIILKGWKQNKPKLYEITFNHKGDLTKQLLIVQKNYDNLEY